jgi:mono/diheme cytochrome c family protein
VIAPLPRHGRRLVVAAGVWLAVGAAASAETGPAYARGEMLYSTYCIACHTQQVHWRQKKLASDWASLNAQVRRWAANAGVVWGDEEVADVARYLNAVHYHFAEPSFTGYERGEFARSLARVD